MKIGKHEVRKREEVDNPYKALPKKQIEAYKVYLGNTSFPIFKFHTSILILIFLIWLWHFLQKSERRQLTEEEMEIKRREMLENANWRDEVRTKNIRRNALRDEEEDRRNEGKTANFIRSCPF